MQFKKWLKYLPATVMSISLIIATLSVPNLTNNQNNINTKLDSKIVPFAENVTTNITVQPPEQFPGDPPVVTDWLDIVTVNGELNRTELEKYLLLTDVPAGAQFVITESVPILETGILTIKIQSTKIMVNGAVRDTLSEVFTVTLKLTPRITKLIPRVDYINTITPSELKAKLFDVNGLVINQTVFNQYVDVQAPVPNSKYYLIENSWIANADNGQVDFSIYAEKYYDADTIEKIGGPNIAASAVDIFLQLQREVSSIKVKAVLPDIRVDKFESYIKTSGNIVSRSKIEEFFDLVNVPDDATFTVGTPVYPAYDANFARNQLTVQLIVSKFYQGNPATSQPYTNSYVLTLGTQHAPTKLIQQPGDIIRADYVAHQLKTLTGLALLEFLRPWYELTSVPATATVKCEDVIFYETTGRLLGRIVLSEIYDAESNLVLPTSDFWIEKFFGIPPPPAPLAKNESYTPVKISIFANNIKSLDIKALYTYLSPDFVDLTSILPEWLSVDIISQDNSTGKISIRISVSQYYDLQNNLVNRSKTEIFAYDMKPVFPPTVIKLLPTSVYPQDITPDQFKQQLITDGAINPADDNWILNETNITFLKKFMIIESIPPETTVTLTFVPETYALTSQLSFTITVNKFYDDMGILIININKGNKLTLNILSPDAPAERPATTITMKKGVVPVDTPEVFLETIKNADGTYILNELGKYLDGLNTLPYKANITNVTFGSVNADGIANFVLETSLFYNGTSINPEANGEFAFTIVTNQITPIVVVFPWWWVLTGIGGSALIGVFAWFAIDKRRKIAAQKKLERELEIYNKLYTKAPALYTRTVVVEETESELLLAIENEKKYIDFLKNRLKELNSLTLIDDPKSKQIAEAEVMGGTCEVILKYQPIGFIYVKAVPSGIVSISCIPWNLNLNLR